MKKLLTLACLFCMAVTSRAQVTFEAKAGNHSYGHYQNLFDGNLDQKWECGANWVIDDTYHKFADDNGNVVFQASEPIYVNGLTLTTGGDTQTYPNRNPYEWIIYGSNDEAAITTAMEETPDYAHSSWAVIAHINNCQMPSLNKTAKSYKFNPSQTAYKYFKFHVVRVVGKDEVQIAELALDYTTTALSPITHVASGTGNYGSETADKIFDGSAETKWCKSNNVSTNWVVFSTEKPICASSYTIQNSNDAEGRDPNKFKLYGASGSSAPTTDGSTDGWTLIDTEDNAKSVLTKDHFAYAHFTMDNPGIYRFFMLKVEETRNASDGNFQMSEFVLDEYDQFADEYMQISSDAEMSTFASQVNSGNTTLKAVLLADVNSSTSIGTESNKFAGEIDGMGHKVNLSINASSDHQGFIGYATGGVTVKNLILTGSVKNTASKTGGFIAEVRGGGTITITNCGNEAKIEGAGGETAAIVANNWGGSCTLNITNVYNIGEVSGSGDVASICAYCGNGSSIFLNVYNSGTVTGDNGGKFVRYSSGTYTNCYCVGKTSKDKETVIDASATDLTSGKLCYKLNGSVDNGTTWTQTIGTDAHPVLFFAGQPVRHASTDCATNLNVSGGNVQIGSADDLVKFSFEVNNGNISMNADVVTDIDMTGKGGSWWPIGKTDAGDTENSGDKAYNGTFDGKNHTIDNLVQDANGNNNQGLFGVVNGGCVIKNLILGSGCHFKGAKFVGAFAGSSRGSGWVTIQNCGNEGTVTASGNNAAAIIGCVVGGGPATKITDCYNRGNVSGNAESAILTGWFGGHGSVQVNNFYNIGSISGHDGGHLYRNNTGITFNNVYHTSANQGATQIGEDWLTSGELCYNLGDSFKQDLSQESYPIPFGTKAVTAGKWFNASDYDVYYNEEGDSYIVYQLNLSEENTEYNVPDNVTATNISVARTIPAGQWIGLCLPFDYDIPEGWDVRELTGVSGSGESASMKFSSASSIVAGKPYIVKPSAIVETITATDKAIASESTDVTFGGVTMVGNLNQTTIPQNSFYINTSSELKKLTATSATLKGFRAYFTVDGSSSVKALSFDFDDDATGINEELRMKNEESTSIFNLAGQRLSKTQKGINIVNGKKILK